MGSNSTKTDNPGGRARPAGNHTPDYDGMDGDPRRERTYNTHDDMFSTDSFRPDSTYHSPRSTMNMVRFNHEDEEIGGPGPSRPPDENSYYRSRELPQSIRPDRQRDAQNAPAQASVTRVNTGTPIVNNRPVPADREFTNDWLHSQGGSRPQRTEPAPQRPPPQQPVAPSYDELFPPTPPPQPTNQPESTTENKREPESTEKPEDENKKVKNPQDIEVESLVPSEPSQAELPRQPNRPLKPVYQEDDDEYIGANLRFYRNEIKFRPNGEYISTIHKYWFGDHQLLEENHFYIQWLFPLAERSQVNEFAVPLKSHESKYIYNDKETRDRVVTSFRVMLDFFGMVLANDTTGEIKRSPAFKDRYYNLKRASHNLLRISRIIKSLGLLGFPHYQAPFVMFLLHEIFETREISGVPASIVLQWIRSIVNTFDREYVTKQFRSSLDKMNDVSRRKRADQIRENRNYPNVGKTTAVYGGKQPRIVMFTSNGKRR